MLSQKEIIVNATVEIPAEEYNKSMQLTAKEAADWSVDRQLSGFSHHVSIKRRMFCIETDQIKRPKITNVCFM